jgi:NADPH:quinone reductase-like Zn-dependent oxidoreductase
VQEIAALIDAGQVRPVVRAVLPLVEARQAYDQVQSGQGGGKVVLQVASDKA